MVQIAYKPMPFQRALIAMSFPDYINVKLVEKALRAFYENEEIQILGMSTKPAVPTGDNYTSDLFRVAVNYKSNKKYLSISIVIKIQPIGNNLETLANGLHLFTKEMEMFGKTLPLLYKVLGPQLNGCLSSLCLLTLEEPNCILLLEDLKPLGYKMAPRQCGLDLDHCKLVMRKLAIFHAASVALNDENSSVFGNYSTGLYVADDVVKNWLKMGLENLAETCLNWPEMKQYGEKLEKLGENAWLRGVHAGNRKLGGFNVLNHGDLWTNNMLFSYDGKGRVTDLKFVDFQLVKYTSPALDLHYFLGTSPAQEVRRDHVTTLLNIYYGHLVANLANLSYSLDTVPTRLAFFDDFKQRGFYGVLAAATVAPLVRASHRSDATFKDLFDNEGVGSFRHHCYNNEEYKGFIRQALPHYDSLGVLN